MPEIDLKHYAEYSRRLQTFARAMGISVLYKEYESDGEWCPHTRRIIINTEQSQSSEIASFLHELGHSLDDLLSKGGELNNQANMAYGALYYGRPTKSQRKLVVMYETKAWKNGRDIAARLKIPLGKWYSQARSYCLGIYRST